MRLASAARRSRALALAAGAAALAALAPRSARAQGSPAPAPGAPTPAEYAARRAALLAGVDSGVVVAFGAVEPVNHQAAYHQLPSFAYLTGHPEADAALLVVKRGGAASATLFVPPRNPRMEKYVGARLGPAEAGARAGVAGRPLAALRPALDSLLAAGLPLLVVPDVQTTDYAEADSLTRGARLVADLRRARPALAVRDLDSLVLALRARKSPAELALLRRAALASARAHREMMAGGVAPGCAEYEVQGALEAAFRRLGGEGPSYASIVASGPNALTLHYSANGRTMQAGDLLLVDAAAYAGGYAADVTRTVPVSGRFTPEQRAVYQIVLDAQAAYVRQIRPGAPRQAAEDSGAAVIGRGLARLGLVDSADAAYDAPEGVRCPPGGCRQRRLYALHGYGGHGIGLDVHDPAQYYDPPHAFRPGDVFTVEPGLYVGPSAFDGLPDTPRNRAMIARVRPAVARYRDIGVRIEDDYAVTDAGVEWLTSAAPRGADEIEAVMRRRPGEAARGPACGARATAALRDVRP